MAQNELNIIVCIKTFVCNTTQKKSKISREFNSFDCTALECGFRLRNEFGGRVDVLSLGPPISVGLMREALAMGADRAILLSDPDSSVSHRLNIARALSAAINLMIPYDLILLGSPTENGGSDKVGPKIAQILDLALINDVESIMRTTCGLQIQRTVSHIEHIKATCKADLPAILAMAPQTPRAEDTDMFGIAAAFEDLEVDIVPLSALDLDQEPAERSEPKAPLPTIISVDPLPKEHCTIVPTGKRVEETDELVHSLHSI